MKIHFTLWHGDDGSNGEVVVAVGDGTMDDPHPRRSSFHLDGLAPKWKKWHRIEGKVGHGSALRSRGSRRSWRENPQGGGGSVIAAVSITLVG